VWVSRFGEGERLLDLAEGREACFLEEGLLGMLSFEEKRLQAPEVPYFPTAVGYRFSDGPSEGDLLFGVKVD
jgi:hypothetical protein